MKYNEEIEVVEDRITGKLSIDFLKKGNHKEPNEIIIQGKDKDNRSYDKVTFNGKEYNNVKYREIGVAKYNESEDDEEIRKSESKADMMISPTKIERHKKVYDK
jgi:hypothetical protein